MKIFILLFLISLLSFSCKTTEYSQRRKLVKEYAFCKCVEFAYGNTLFKNNNDISTGVYRDIAGYNMNAYDSIDSLAYKFAMKIEPSIIADHENKKVIFLRCFDFFYSKDLDSLIKKNKKLTIFK